MYKDFDSHFIQKIKKYYLDDISMEIVEIVLKTYNKIMTEKCSASAIQEILKKQEFSPLPDIMTIIKILVYCECPFYS